MDKYVDSPMGQAHWPGLWARPMGPKMAAGTLLGMSGVTGLEGCLEVGEIDSKIRDQKDLGFFLQLTPFFCQETESLHSTPADKHKFTACGTTLRQDSKHDAHGASGAGTSMWINLIGKPCRGKRPGPHILPT